MHDLIVILGFVAGALYIASHYMKTMVPLRVCEIGSNFLFVIYGLMYPSWPTLALYGILVPLNSLRLYEMLQLVKKVRTAATGDLSMDWLKPFMHKHSYKKGDFLFHKGDHAEEMFYIVSGTCRIDTLGLDLHAGQLVGEMGFLTPDHKRTQTVECVEDVEMLTITYDKVSELYFQNPTFGFYFLRLTSERLLQNVHRLEHELAARPQIAQV
ncbi:MAG: cyclic nucleotide-binding domain-containing protein [Rhodopseudomonas sp.]|nr:cyclic nucleotide-binding domain-containing protein [Rhodopseudomonas sp.]